MFVNIYVLGRGLSQGYHIWGLYGIKKIENPCTTRHNQTDFMCKNIPQLIPFYPRSAGNLV